MSDNPPFPPSKSGVNPRSLANLRPCKKGDPSPNKTGANGRTRGEKVAAFLDEVDDTTLGKSLQAKIGCPGVSRIEAVLHREWLAAMGKSDLARKGLREAYAGKPHQAVDISNDDKSLAGASAAVALVDAVVTAALEKLRNRDDEGNGGATPAVT
jgi:hypothetical protein